MICQMNYSTGRWLLLRSMSSESWWVLMSIRKKNKRNVFVQMVLLNWGFYPCILKTMFSLLIAQQEMWNCVKYHFSCNDSWAWLSHLKRTSSFTQPSLLACSFHPRPVKCATRGWDLWSPGWCFDARSKCLSKRDFNPLPWPPLKSFWRIVWPGPWHQ